MRKYIRHIYIVPSLDKFKAGINRDDQLQSAILWDKAVMFSRYVKAETFLLQNTAFIRNQII